MEIEYKFNEGELIADLKRYIDKTYEEHYSVNNIQSIEVVFDKGFEYATGFCMGNVQKYSDRYGEKGDSPAEWRKDLVKTIHYSLFQLYLHDEEFGE